MAELLKNPETPSRAALPGITSTAAPPWATRRKEKETKEIFLTFDSFASWHWMRRPTSTPRTVLSTPIPPNPSTHP
ncbi:hypothetical protein E2C01_080107 [Portunus trituberculatus]|uniref:Uncharacterized protein n=1 Tax=Portunus trituberculatus TaxID=210409 RepID=A0A5B7IV47_PORTR|nr:hypothetical protein [Portunus trituberculatus]